MRPRTSPNLHQQQLWLALRFPALPWEVQGLRVNEVDADFERNTQLEYQVLQQLAQCCYHFSPYVEIQSGNSEPGLLLELSRCLKLFKGAHALTKGLFKQLRTSGYHFEFGLAHTAAGAWLLSWQQHPVCDDDSREIFMQRLQSTPVHLLQSNEKTISALDLTGFRILGDVIKQIQATSLASLRKRFGQELSSYMEDVFAIESQQQQSSLFSKPALAYQPKVYFCEHMQLDYPLDNIELLKPVMENLLQKLQQFLRKRLLQSDSVVWRLFDIYQNVEEFKISTCQLHQQDNSASWRLFLDLSVIQFENHSLPFAVDTVELLCEKLESIKAHTGLLALDGKNKNNSEDLQITLARVQARLGDNAMYKVSYRAHHVPEKSVERVSLAEAVSTDMSAEQKLAERPGWLLKIPQKIQLNETELFWQGRLSLLQGPERIEGYWWEEYCARDYYIARREDELKLWVYQDLQNNNWYTHGIFS